MCPQKLKIRIKRPLSEVVITRKVERDGANVVIWKLKGNRPEWKLKFDRSSIYQTKKFPIGKMDTVDAFPYADQAVQYDYEAQEEHQPIYDRETEDKYVRAKVLEELGEGDKRKTDPILWIIFIMLILVLGLNFIQFWNKFIGA